MSLPSIAALPLFQNVPRLSQGGPLAYRERPKIICCSLIYLIWPAAPRARQSEQKQRGRLNERRPIDGETERPAAMAVAMVVAAAVERLPNAKLIIVWVASCTVARV